MSVPVSSDDPLLIVVLFFSQPTSSIPKANRHASLPVCRSAAIIYIPYQALPIALLEPILP
jgi:hypothetical protein